jgi:hypothetical protein
MTDDVDRSKPKMNNIMTIRQLNLLYSGQDEFGVQPPNASKTFNIDTDFNSRFKREAIVRKDLPHVHVMAQNLHIDPFLKNNMASCIFTFIFEQFNWTEYFEVLFDGIMAIDENTTVIVMDLGYIHALATVLDRTNRHDVGKERRNF